MKYITSILYDFASKYVATTPCSSFCLKELRKSLMTFSFRCTYTTTDGNCVSILNTACEQIEPSHFNNLGDESSNPHSELSSKVFHPHVAPGSNFRHAIIKFASTYVQRQILTAMLRKNRQFVTALLRNLSGVPSLGVLRGTLLEPYCHGVFARGCKLKCVNPAGIKWFSSRKNDEFTVSLPKGTDLVHIYHNFTLTRI